MPRESGIERICLSCGKPFFIWPSDLNYSKGLFCSNQCSTHHRLGSEREFFESRINKQEIWPYHWYWTGAKANYGYGLIRWEGNRERAHRVAWIIYKGPIPQGIMVLHNCPGGDIPACVNPEHLFLGSQADNIRDMMAKGRKRNKPSKGIDNGAAKLTEADIAIIRSLEDTRDAEKLAKIFDVTPRSVHNIWERKTWCHLP